MAGTAERLTPSGERPGIRSSMARSADALFFAQAAHGSTGEIRLSRMALDKSSDPAVKEFARQMIDDHVQLNAQLAELAEREGQGLPSRPTNHMEQLAQRFARESGDRFDRDYMAQMVNDHIRTLSMFDQAARTASDPSVRAFAESKVPELQAHLQKAQELNEALGSTAGK